MTAGPAAREPVRHADEAAGPTATLAEVDIRHELSTRPSRRPDSEGLALALVALAREMTDNPRRMLQKLVETALGLCKADTPGISLLEGDVFRWEAVARRMREEAPESNLTIIALSGYGQAEDHRRSMQTGCNAHLVKPVHPNVLRSMLAAQTPILSSI